MAKYYMAGRSLPAWGAWIEIAAQALAGKDVLLCRSPHGERGLKCAMLTNRRIYDLRRSPHGERGLKLEAVIGAINSILVAPRMGSVD